MNPNPLTTSPKRVQLLASEKAALKASIFRAVGRRTIPESPIPSPVFAYLGLFRTVGALSIMLLVTGSTLTYAAQNSGPGDTLYALELGVIEPIEASLQLSPAQKVTYHTKRLEERLSELKKARSEGTADNEDYQALAEHAGEHAAKIDAVIDEAETEPRQKIATLVTVNALLQASDELLDDVESDSFHASEAELRNELTHTTDAYGKDTDPDTIRQSITEDIADTAKELGEESDKDTLDAIAAQLLNIDGQVVSGDLHGAVESVTKVRIEVKKQKLLNVGTLPEEIDGDLPEVQKNEE